MVHERCVLFVAEPNAAVVKLYDLTSISQEQEAERQSGEASS